MKAKRDYPEKPKRRFAEKPKRRFPEKPKTTFGVQPKRTFPVSKPATKVSPRQQALMTGFKFSSQDLEANREGKLSPLQKGYHIKSIYNYLWRDSLIGGYMGALTFGIAPTVLLFMIFWGDWENTKRMFPLAMMSGFFAIVFLIPIIKSYNLMGIVQGDLSEGDIQKAQGLVVIPAPQNNVAPTIEIDKHQYRTPKGALTYIKHLEPHIVYFLPRSKIIVSVEVVED